MSNLLSLFGDSEFSGKLIGPMSPISYINEVESAVSEMPGFQFVAIPADLSRASHHELSSIKYGRVGTGFSFTSRHSAIMKAVGEALESYSGAYYTRRASLVLCSADDLRRRKIFHTAPELYCRFFPYSNGIQDNFGELNNNTRITWVEGTCFEDSDKIFVPAQYGLYPSIRSRAECQIVQCTSNGVATHSDYYKCLLSAVGEIIERDSILIHWWFNIKPHRIKPSSFFGMIEDAYGAFKSLRLDLRLYCFDSAVGWKTVLACIYQNDTPYLNWMSGHASSPCMISAAESAVEELVKGFKCINHADEKKKSKVISSDEKIKGVLDHGLFYCNDSNWLLLDNFLSHQCEVELEHQSKICNVCHGLSRAVWEENLTEICQEFHGAAMVEISSPDMKRMGFHILRVVLPGSVPICFGNPMGYWVNERVLKQVKKWGGKTDLSKINRLPHPLS